MTGSFSNSVTCSFAFPAADFKETGRVEAILGWTGATTGMLTLDAVSLIKRSH